MAEDETSSGIAREVIGLDDFLRFLAAKKIPGECELCRANDWNSMTEHEEHIPVLIYKPIPGDLSSGSGMPLAVMTCKNCGNVRTYRRSVVLNWIKANPNG